MHSVLEKHYKEGNLSHAYFLVGEKDTAVSVVSELADVLLARDLKAALSGQTDFFKYIEGALGIDEVKSIKHLASMKGFSDRGKVFLIDARNLTYEAMHAFLKIIEEPPPRTHFFLFSSDFDNLIPTLKSRLNVIHLGGTAAISEAKTNFIKKFLKTSPPGRMVYVQKICQTREKSLAFMESLEKVLADFFEKESKRRLQLAPFMEEMGELRALISHKSSSFKMILEHIALTLPKIQ